MTSLQTVVVDRETARVSKETCDALRPRHRKIVNEIATRLRALGEILEEEYRFRATLDAAGVASHSSWLRPLPQGQS